MVQTLRRHKETYKSSSLELGISNNLRVTKTIHKTKAKKTRKLLINKQGAGGLFDLITLKFKLYKVNNIFGQLNRLEKKIKDEAESYEVQMNSIEALAKAAAKEQTNYIVNFRKHLILKIYKKDTEQITKKDTTRMAALESDLEITSTKLEQAKKNYEVQAGEMGKNVPELRRLSKKLQRELKEFNKVSALREQLKPYQIKIEQIKKMADEAEGKSSLSKKYKANLANYRAHKADYDRVLDLSDQNMENVRALQVKILSMQAKAEYFKNQFGIYKKESSSVYGSRTAGDLDKGLTKASKKLKEWSRLQESFGAKLLTVNGALKSIEGQMEELAAAVLVCREMLVSVPEDYDKKPNIDAIKWFLENVEKSVLATKEMKKMFSDMKNEFYNQISADKVFVNYTASARYINFIEIKLKMYGWMVKLALKRNEGRDKSSEEGKKLEGGWRMIGGSQGRPKPRRDGDRGRGRGDRDDDKKSRDIDVCKDLNEPATNILKIKLDKWIFQGSNISHIKEKFVNDNNPESSKICINNLFNYYLLSLFLFDNILDETVLDKYKESITALAQIKQVIDSEDLKDPLIKKVINKKLEKIKVKTFKDITDQILGKIKKEDTIPLNDLLEKDAGGNLIKKAGLDRKFENLANYFINKQHLKDYIFKLMDNSDKFYGILEYEESRADHHLKNLIDDSKYTDINDDEDYTKLKEDQDKDELDKVKKEEEEKRKRDKAAVSKSELLLTESTNTKIKDDLDKLDSILTAENAENTYPRQYFEIQTLLTTCYTQFIKRIADILGDDAKTTRLPDLDKFTSVLNTVKKDLETGSPSISIEEFEKNTNKLMEFQTPYSAILAQYDAYAANSGIGKENAKEIFKKMIGSLERGKDISEIRILADRDAREYAPIPDVKKEGVASTTGSNSTISSPSVAKTDEELKAEKEAKEKDQEDARKEDWYKQLEESSKQSANYISNILLRIPPQYTNALETVTAKFEEIKSILDKLTMDGSMKKLNEAYLEMTKELLEIKDIEGDLIEIKVKDEPKKYLGLQNYILETPSLETKSSVNYGKVKELTDEIMKSKFYLDTGGVADEEEIYRIFDRLLAKANKDGKSLTLDYYLIEYLRKNKANVNALLKRIKTYADINNINENNYYNEKNKNGDYRYIEDYQLRLCSILKGIQQLVVDKESEKQDIQNKMNSISNTCAPKQKEGKGKGKGRDDK